jgi:hypothetical protein
LVVGASAIDDRCKVHARIGDAESRGIGHVLTVHSAPQEYQEPSPVRTAPLTDPSAGTAGAGEEVDEFEGCAVAEAELEDQVRICGLRLAAGEHRLS